MTRECHVRFCESAEVQFLRATHRLIQAIQYGETIIGIAEVEHSLPRGLIAVGDTRTRLSDVERSHIAAAIRLMAGAHADVSRANSSSSIHRDRRLTLAPAAVGRGRRQSALVFRRLAARLGQLRSLGDDF
jgi:hypothetical protein